jgi:hypothetical protein
VARICCSAGAAIRCWRGRIATRDTVTLACGRGFDDRMSSSIFSSSPSSSPPSSSVAGPFDSRLAAAGAGTAPDRPAASRSHAAVQGLRAPEIGLTPADFGRLIVSITWSARESNRSSDTSTGAWPLARRSRDTHSCQR